MALLSITDSFCIFKICFIKQLMDKFFLIEIGSILFSYLLKLKFR